MVSSALEIAEMNRLAELAGSRATSARTWGAMSSGRIGGIPADCGIAPLLSHSASPLGRPGLEAVRRATSTSQGASEPLIHNASARRIRMRNVA